MKTVGVLLALAAILHGTVALKSKKTIPVRQRIEDLIEYCEPILAITVASKINPKKPLAVSDGWKIITEDLALKDTLTRINGVLQSGKGDNATFIETSATEIDCLSISIALIAMDEASAGLLAGGRDRVCVDPDADEKDVDTLVGCMENIIKVIDDSVDTILNAGGDDDYSVMGLPLVKIEAGIVALSNGLGKLERTTSGSKSASSRELLTNLLRNLKSGSLATRGRSSEKGGKSGRRPKCEENAMNIGMYLEKKCPETEDDANEVLSSLTTPLTIAEFQDRIKEIDLEAFTKKVADELPEEEGDFDWLEKEWQDEVCDVIRPLVKLSMEAAAAEMIAPPCPSVDMENPVKSDLVDCLKELLPEAIKNTEAVDDAVKNEVEPEKLVEAVVPMSNSIGNIDKAFGLLQDLPEVVEPAKRNTVSRRYFV